ncbi:MAG: hypothetical protein R2726_09420 [Acidimicrobiales bacterium]
MQALSRLGGGAAVTAGLAFLDGVQAGSGGFAFVPGGDPDPNSTALVVQAIVAGERTPRSGDGRRGDQRAGRPAVVAAGLHGGRRRGRRLHLTVLRRRAGCVRHPAGGVGASGQAFPPAPSSFAAVSVPCQSTGSTTSTTTVTSGPTDVVVAPGTSGGGAVLPAFTG